MITLIPGLHEFDNLKSAEVSDFRQKMRRVCEGIAKERDGQVRALTQGFTFSVYANFQRYQVNGDRPCTCISQRHTFFIGRWVDGTGHVLEGGGGVSRNIKHCNIMLYIYIGPLCTITEEDAYDVP